MNLNDKQKEVVTTTKNKVLVQAAAASGKTACLIERLNWLLQMGQDPKKIVAITFTNNAAAEIKERLIMEADGMFIGTVHSYCNYLLRAGGVATDTILDEDKFDDLFLLIEDNPHCIREIDHLIVDEAQDSTELQFAFFELLSPKNFMYFFDIRQCQPAGTKILLADKTEKNIEELVGGEQIIAYNRHGGIQGGIAHNSKRIFISEIQEREITEPLIKVTLENGATTSYTFGHKCIANLQNNTNNYLVYLMCDSNNRFRVGKSQFRNKANNPWRKKMNDEKCVKMWIIKTFKTDKEARVLEDKISYKYQIPQITFQLDKTTYTKEDIDYIYENLDTEKSAIQCLKDFNKDINFPMATVFDDIHYAGNAFNMVYACNLIEKNMNMMVYNENFKKRYESVPIKKVEIIPPIKRKVYSLNVPELHSYIGDNIVTHNCIYGFAGAYPDYLILLKHKDGVTLYELNQNYRNGNAILNQARKVINSLGREFQDHSIPMRHTQGRFIYGELSYEGIVKTLIGEKFGDWFILCRSNKEVETMCFVLKKNGIPCDTFKQGDLNNQQIQDRMKADTVKVLTVHSAKGLEANKVLVYDPRLYNDEERRLYYVAATRARDVLLWIKPPKRSKKKTTNWE